MYDDRTINITWDHLFQSEQTAKINVLSVKVCMPAQSLDGYVQRWIIYH